MREDSNSCTLGVTGGILEEIGGNGSMHRSIRFPADEIVVVCEPPSKVLYLCKPKTANRKR